MHRFLAVLVTVILSLPLAAQVPEKKGDQKTSDQQEEGLSKQKVSIWRELKSRYDKNHDHRITDDEYDRGEKRFRRMDRNDDGVISGDDFLMPEVEAKSEKLSISRPRAFAKIFEITEREPFQIDNLVVWYWLRDDNLDGVLTPNEMGARGMPAEGRILRVFDPDLSADISLEELENIAKILDVNQDGFVDRSEVASKRMVRGEGPLLGDVAPDFELAMKTGDEKVRLSTFKDQRPVALVFGSYT